MLALNADGSDPIRDAAGYRLDGEWINPASTGDSGTSAFPSGNGVAGGDFHFRFNVLPGDATQDGSVNAADLNQVLANYNGTGMNWSQGDVTGDGAVGFADLNKVLTNYNLGLPSGTPAAAAFPASVPLVDPVMVQSASLAKAAVVDAGIASALGSQTYPAAAASDAGDAADSLLAASVPKSSLVPALIDSAIQEEPDWGVSGP